jgi:hypothetical protein
MNKTQWKFAYWILFACWVIGALLNYMGIAGGFLTNYLADLTFPPWFYISLRGLWNVYKNKPYKFQHWFASSPEKAALSIFAVGTIGEIITLYWPAGMIRGTFDPLDILAYGIGLAFCYYLDKRTQKNRS